MSAIDASRFALSIAIAIGVTGSAPAMTFDVFDIALTDGWRALSQSAGEKSWSRLDAKRTGLIVTLYRSPRPFEQDPSAKAGRVVTRGAAVLGGLPATAYEWRSAAASSALLHFLVRCTNEPLRDGQHACAMAGTAGTDLEPHRFEMAALLDGIGIARAAATSPLPAPPRPVTPDAGTARTTVDANMPARIEMSEMNGLWIGVWTLRPGTNIYDAVWRSVRFPEVRDVVRLAGVSGNTIVFTRDGNGGRYTGTMTPDGTITGTASWYSAGMTWSGRMVRSAAAVIPESRPVSANPPPTLPSWPAGRVSSGGTSLPPVPPSRPTWPDRSRTSANTAPCGAADPVDRRAILDSVRGTVAKALGQTIEFRVTTLRVCGNWAFMIAEPRRPDGGAIQWNQTVCRSDTSHLAGALSQRDTQGTWRLVDHALCPSDVAWADWPDKYGLPDEILGF